MVKYNQLIKTASELGKEQSSNKINAHHFRVQRESKRRIDLKIQSYSYSLHQESASPLKNSIARTHLCGWRQKHHFAHQPKIVALNMYLFVCLIWCENGIVFANVSLLHSSFFFASSIKCVTILLFCCCSLHFFVIFCTNR